MAEKRPKAGTVRQVKLEELAPFPGNARRGDVDMIADSLRAHGQFKPIVVNADMTILAGNHTWQAAQALEWPAIKCFFVDVDATEAAKINLIDNRSNDVAGYDTEALVEQLRELPDLEATGYDEAALQQLLGQINDEPGGGEADPDDVPAVAPSRVDPGDLWQLGDHFLICGDATKPEVLEKLMGAEQAHMVWTDPPYNVDYASKQEALSAWDGADRNDKAIANDLLAADDFSKLLTEALSAALPVTVEGGGIYIAHADTMRIQFELAMLQAGWRYAQTLIWVKDRFVLGRQDYQWQHEPILYGWRPGSAHRWFGAFDKTTVKDDEPDTSKLSKDELRDLVEELRNERASTVVREDKPAKSEHHQVVKPTELVQRHIQNSSTRGDVVLDPFGGSGTTIIAAETLGRAARMVELEASYCDVVLSRWEKFTGRKAKIRKAR